MMKKFLGAAALATAGAMAFAGGAAANEERKFEWSMTIGATSDYIFRGISLSDESPAFQMSVDASYGIFYMGIWGSNLDGGAIYGPYEIDIYAGIKPEAMGFTFDFGAVGYIYPDGDDFGSDGNYVELKAGVSRELVKNLTGGFILWYTPSQSNYNETITYEASLAYQLPEMHRFTPTISGGYGYSDDRENAGLFFGDDNYSYWNAGLGLAIENWSMDFRYWDTDISNGLADERFVFSAKVTVP